MERFREQRIRDPLHDLIIFNADAFENMLWDVINTRPFQRLRRIRQLGFSDLTYPGATHSRFAHSVGVFHTARMLMQIIADHLDNQIEDHKAETALAAALVHDVGHGPFSHSFEDIGRRLNLELAKHEKVSERLIRESEIAECLKTTMGSGFADDVADLVLGRGEKHIYESVVSSQFDADRLDYMRRDRLMTGTRHSGIDFTWLLANLEVGEIPIGEDDRSLGKIETFVLGPKARQAAEAYVLGLFQLYPTVYFHKTTRGAEKLFTELMIRVIQLIQNGSLKKTGLTASHPIAKFAKKPKQIDSVLDLDDTVVWGSLSLLTSAKDKAVSALAYRLKNRELYKAIDIRSRVGRILTEKAKASLKDNAENEERIEKACARIQIKLKEWISENTSDVPRVLIDQDERSPYKDFQESKGPLNQIFIRVEDQEERFVDIKTRSEVVKAISSYKFLRAYVAEEDSEAITLVEKLIDSETVDA